MGEMVEMELMAKMVRKNKLQFNDALFTINYWSAGELGVI